MDSMQINKAIAAVLVAGIAFFVTGMLGDALVHVQRPAKPAIEIQVAQHALAAAAAPAGPAPIAPLLASADLKTGEDYANKVCAACHAFNEGGPNKVGPDLYGVLGRPVASHPGFDFSSALKGKHGPWTYDELNDWLYKPAAYAPGTRMAFAGISNDKTRAAVIAYLRSLSHNPEPLPKVEAAPAAAPAATPATAASPAAPATAAGPAPIEPLLVHANPAAGEAYTKKICVACHTFNKGGHPGVGPNLYGVVGQPHAREEGYSYSAALKGKQGPWTFDALNQWLYSPSAYAPGTKMAFPGIKNNQDRADVIAYLNQNSDHPEPIPAAQGAAQPAATQTPAPSPAAAGATQQGGGSAGTTPGPTPPSTNQGGAPPESPTPAAKSP